MNRRLPRHCDMFLACARKARLSHVLGRALYACNGIQNGRFHFAVLVPTCSRGTVSQREDVVAVLKTIRPSTAKRWLKHWKSGGSIKSLSHGSAGRIR